MRPICYDTVVIQLTARNRIYPLAILVVFIFHKGYIIRRRFAIVFLPILMRTNSKP